MKLIQDLMKVKKQAEKAKVEKEKPVDTSPKEELKAKEKQVKDRVIPDKKTARQEMVEEGKKFKSCQDMVTSLIKDIEEHTCDDLDDEGKVSAIDRTLDKYRSAEINESVNESLDMDKDDYEKLYKDIGQALHPIYVKLINNIGGEIEDEGLASEALSKAVREWMQDNLADF